MARPDEKRAASLADAVAHLKRDPARSVRLHVDDVDVELHLVGREGAANGLGDFMAEGGGWQGQSADEILRMLREARKSGAVAEPPEGL
jgi:hypothetical protein